jgi:arylsulfatase A-like enzyme
MSGGLPYSHPNGGSTGFMARPAAISRALRRRRAGIAAALVLACAAGCRQPETPASVLILVVDTLRADRVAALSRSPSGATTMPVLDAWAREAAVFRRAVAPAPFTMPSVAALMTGAWPDRCGVPAHEPGTTLAGWKGATFAETARAAGFATAAVVANPWLARQRTGFDRGFDRYLRLYRPELPAGTSDAAAVTDAAIAELDRFGGRRFVLWAHYFDPHMPYRPPASALAPEDASTKSAVMDDFDAKTRDLSAIYSATGYPAQEIELARRLYDGEVRHADREIGRLLGHLERSGRARDTVVVVASDHGESLGEHGLFFAHDYTLYEELVHAVLMFRGPRVPAGVRDDEVSLIDVTPTLCRLAGLDCPTVSDGRDLFGGDRSNRTLFAATSPRRSRGTPFARLSVPGLAGRWTMALRDGKKLLRLPTPDGPKIELYDLVRDPAEMHDLARDLAPDRRSLEDELDRWTSEMNAVRPAAAPASAGSRRDRRALRSLGYLQ